MHVSLCNTSCSPVGFNFLCFVSCKCRPWCFTWTSAWALLFELSNEDVASSSIWSLQSRQGMEGNLESLCYHCPLKPGRGHSIDGPKKIHWNEYSISSWNILKGYNFLSFPMTSRITDTLMTPDQGWSAVASCFKCVTASSVTTLCMASRIRNQSVYGSMVHFQLHPSLGERACFC